MVLESLAPGVEHGDEPDLGTEMTGIGGDGTKGRGSTAKQDVVNDALVLQGNCGDWLGDGEDDMEVRHRQQVGLARFQPGSACQGLTLGAVAVAAGVVGDADVRACVTLLCVTAQGSGPAELYGAHDA